MIATTPYNAKLDPLAGFVRDGDYKRCKEWIDAGNPVLNLAAQGKSPLVEAAANGFFSIVELLLDCGDWKAYPDELAAALQVAVETGHVSNVQILLDRGASPEAVSWYEVFDTHSHEITRAFLLHGKEAGDLGEGLCKLERGCVKAMAEFVPGRPDLQEPILKDMAETLDEAAMYAKWAAMETNRPEFREECEKTASHAGRHFWLMASTGVDVRRRFEDGDGNATSILEYTVKRGTLSHLRTLRPTAADFPAIVAAAKEMERCDEGKMKFLLKCGFELNDRKVLYVSGEESGSQIKMRAQRIRPNGSDCYILSETSLERIFEQANILKPEILIIDSIQTMFLEEVTSAPGSVSQVRESTGVFMRLAKGLNVSILIVGHVTKEGTVAGPRDLEHMVDTVLYFEGDGSNAYRILRSVKNRFGSTNEIGVFEMGSEGLIEVLNPSEYMLSGRPIGASGSVTVCTMEGSRPLLVEIQALVCRTSFGMPRRQATGVDLNLVNLLMAVLEKRIGLKTGDCDAYINVAGGMRLQERAVDLGIALAVVSCYEDIPIDSNWVVFGEVGLSGEIRSVSGIAQRIREAEKMGFSTCILPKSALEKLQIQTKIRLIGAADLGEAIRAVKNAKE